MSLNESISYIFNRPLLNEEIKVSKRDRTAQGDKSAKFTYIPSDKGATESNPDIISNTGRISDKDIIQPGSANLFHRALDRVYNDQDFRNNLAASLIAALSGKYELVYAPDRQFRANTGSKDAYNRRENSLHKDDWDDSLVEVRNPIKKINKIIDDTYNMLFNGTKSFDNELDAVLKKPPVLSKDMSAAEVDRLFNAIKNIRLSNIIDSRLNFTTSRSNPYLNMLTVSGGLMKDDPDEAEKRLQALSTDANGIIVSIWKRCIEGAAISFFYHRLIDEAETEKERSTLLKLVFGDTKLKEINFKALEKWGKWMNTRFNQSANEAAETYFGKNEQLLLEGENDIDFSDYSFTDNSDSADSDSSSDSGATVSLSDLWGDTTEQNSDDSTTEQDSGNEHISEIDDQQDQKVEVLDTEEADKLFITNVYWEGKQMTYFNSDNIWFAPYSIIEPLVENGCEKLRAVFNETIDHLVSGITAKNLLSAGFTFQKTGMYLDDIKYARRELEQDINALMTFILEVLNATQTLIKIPEEQGGSGEEDLYVLMPGGLHSVVDMCNRLITLLTVKNKKYVSVSKENMSVTYLPDIVTRKLNSAKTKVDSRTGERVTVKPAVVNDKDEGTYGRFFDAIKGSVEECKREDDQRITFSDKIGYKLAACLNLLARDASHGNPPINISSIDGFKRYITSANGCPIRDKFVEKLNERYGISPDKLVDNASSFQDVYDNLAKLELEYVRRNPDDSVFINNILTRQKSSFKELLGRKSKSKANAWQTIQRLFTKIIQTAQSDKIFIPETENKDTVDVEKVFDDKWNLAIENNWISFATDKGTADYIKDVYKDYIIGSMAGDRVNFAMLDDNIIKNIFAANFDKFFTTVEINRAVKRILGDDDDIEWNELSFRDKLDIFPDIKGMFDQEVYHKGFNTVLDNFKANCRAFAGNVAGAVFDPIGVTVWRNNKKEPLIAGAIAGDVDAGSAKNIKLFNDIYTWAANNGFNTKELSKASLIVSLQQLSKTNVNGASTVNSAYNAFISKMSQNKVLKSNSTANLVDKNISGFVKTLIARVQKAIDNIIKTKNQVKSINSLNDALDAFNQAKSEEEVNQIIDSISIKGNEAFNNASGAERYKMIADILGGEILLPAILIKALKFKRGVGGVISKTDKPECVEITDNLSGLVQFIKRHIPDLFVNSMAKHAKRNTAKELLANKAKKFKELAEQAAEQAAEAYRQATNDKQRKLADQYEFKFKIFNYASEICADLAAKNPEYIIEISDINLFTKTGKGNTMKLPDWTNRIALAVYQTTGENGENDFAFVPEYRFNVRVTDNIFNGKNANGTPVTLTAENSKRAYTVADPNNQGSNTIADIGYLKEQDYNAFMSQFSKMPKIYQINRQLWYLGYIFAMSGTDDNGIRMFINQVNNNPAFNIPADKPIENISDLAQFCAQEIANNPEITTNPGNNQVNTQLIVPFSDKINTLYKQHLFQAVGRATSTHLFNVSSRNTTSNNELDATQSNLNAFRNEHDSAASFFKHLDEKSSDYQRMLKDMWPSGNYRITFGVNDAELRRRIANQSILFGVASNWELAADENESNTGTAFEGDENNRRAVASTGSAIEAISKQEREQLINKYGAAFSKAMNAELAEDSAKRYGNSLQLKAIVDSFVQNENNTYTCEFTIYPVIKDKKNYDIKMLFVTAVVESDNDADKKFNTCKNNALKLISRAIKSRLSKVKNEEAKRLSNEIDSTKFTMVQPRTNADIIIINKTDIESARNRLNDIISLNTAVNSLKDNMNAASRKDLEDEINNKIDKLDGDDSYFWTYKEDYSTTENYGYLGDLWKDIYDSKQVSVDDVMKHPWVDKLLSSMSSNERVFVRTLAEQMLKGLSTVKKEISTDAFITIFAKYIKITFKELLQLLSNNKVFGSIYVSNSFGYSSTIALLSLYNYQQAMEMEVETNKNYDADFALASIADDFASKLMQKAVTPMLEYIRQNMSDRIFAAKGASKIVINLCSDPTFVANTILGLFKKDMNLLKQSRERISEAIADEMPNLGIKPNEDSEEEDIEQLVANYMKFDKYDLPVETPSSTNSEKSFTDDYKRQYMMNDWKHEYFWNNYQI